MRPKLDVKGDAAPTPKCRIKFRGNVVTTIYCTKNSVSGVLRHGVFSRFEILADMKKLGVKPPPSLRLTAKGGFQQPVYPTSAICNNLNLALKSAGVIDLSG